MARLASALRNRDVVVTGLWTLSVLTAALAAVREWGLVLVLALALNYVSDERLNAGDPRVAQWLANRQLGAPQRHLFRQAAAIFGWMLITRPGPVLVLGTIAGVLVVHGTHAAYQVLGAHNRRRRRGRVTWRNLWVDGEDAGPQILPTTMPRLASISGPRWALHLDVFLVAGLAASWLFATDWPVWAGLATVVVGSAFVAWRVLARRGLVRRLPTPEQERASVLTALEQHAPEVVVYFSGGPDTTYQLNVWLETIDRMEQPTVIFIRELHHLDTLLPTRTPVLVVPRAQDVAEFQIPSMKVALYPTTVIKNNHMIRLRGLRHIFINHGDGDKAVTYSPLHRVFDEIWVAGQAACDRYLDRGEGVRADQLVRVGRPQLAHIHPVDTTSPRTEGPLTVLYAPTWEGNFEGVNYSSVAPMGPQIIDALLRAGRDVRILFKAHPATGTRLAKAASARARIERRLRESGTHQVVGSEPDALYRAFNDADVLIADVSSVVADFLASRKPYIVTNPRGIPLEDFRRDFPSTSGGGVLGADARDLRELLDDATGPDTFGPRRRELATYFLGEPVADPIQRFVDEVAAALARGQEALAHSAALAQEAALEAEAEVEEIEG